MTGILDFSLQASFLILAVALAVTLVRGLRGPALGDRIVALDLLLLIAVGLMGTYAISSREPAILDAGVLIALIAFLGTTAMAVYLEGRSR